MSEWISVKDRLPQEKEVVLTYESAFDSMSMAFRLPNTEEFINVGDYYALDAVTHWMPLPNPPEDTESLKLSYRGYTATIEYDDDDKLWHGKLDKIHDMINFHSFKAEEIEREFHNAVNDYLDFCKEIGKKPEEPHDKTATN